MFSCNTSFLENVFQVLQELSKTGPGMKSRQPKCWSNFLVQSIGKPAVGRMEAMAHTHTHRKPSKNKDLTHLVKSRFIFSEIHIISSGSTRARVEKPRVEKNCRRVDLAPLRLGRRGVARLASSLTYKMRTSIINILKEGILFTELNLEATTWYIRKVLV